MLLFSQLIEHYRFLEVIIDERFSASFRFVHLHVHRVFYQTAFEEASSKGVTFLFNRFLHFAQACRSLISYFGNLHLLLLFSQLVDFLVGCFLTILINKLHQVFLEVSVAKADLLLLQESFDLPHQVNGKPTGALFLGFSKIVLVLDGVGHFLFARIIQDNVHSFDILLQPFILILCFVHAFDLFFHRFELLFSLLGGQFIVLRLGFVVLDLLDEELFIHVKFFYDYLELFIPGLQFFVFSIFMLLFVFIVFNFLVQSLDLLFKTLQVCFQFEISLFECGVLLVFLRQIKQALPQFLFQGQDGGIG